MKPGRQSVILEIIKEMDIETQGQLMLALAERGVKSTQATLSRDIKDLRLVKEQGADGKYRYTQSGSRENDASSEKLRRIFKDSLVSYDVAQNLLVVKTLPGLAHGACSAIDGMKIDGIVGTIAGDDTAFIAMRDNEAAIALYHQIEGIFTN